MGLLRIETDVRVVLEHSPRQMPRERFDHGVRFAGFKQSLAYAIDCLEGRIVQRDHASARLVHASLRPRALTYWRRGFRRSRRGPTLDGLGWPEQRLLFFERLTLACLHDDGDFQQWREFFSIAIRAGWSPDLPSHPNGRLRVGTELEERCA